MGVKILSLFDGMACGMIAMQLAGVEVESYDAYEIDKYAIKTAQHNFPMIKEHGDVFGADFTQYEGVDFLVGGSPCTYWSIAQTKNRETVASGMGWELFSQYVRALHEAKPKYFIYENNKSMSKQIRASIDKAFDFEAVLINSALVSAQNRQRLYWVGKRNADGTYSKVNVEQPEDRGILLKDVLDNAVAMREKAHAVIASAGRTTEREFFMKNQGNMVAEPVRGIVNDTKSRTLTANYWKTNVRDAFVDCAGGRTMAAEPVCLRYERTEEAKRCRKAYEAHEIKHGYNELNELHPRPDGKTNTLTTVLKDNQIMEPVCVAERGRMYCGQPQHYEARTDGKTNTLTSVEKDNRVAEPVACRCRGRVDASGNGYAKYECREDGKSNTLDTNTTNGAMVAEPINVTANGKAKTISASYAYKGDGEGSLKSELFPDNPIKQTSNYVAEPINTDANGKAFCVTSRYYKGFGNNQGKCLEKHRDSMVAESVALSMVGDFGNRKVSVSDKAYCLAANPSSDMSARVAEPVCVAERGRMYCGQPQHYEARTDGKTNTLTSVEKDNRVAEPVKVGHVGNGGQGNRVYSVNGKAVAQTAQSGGMGSNTGLYAIPYSIEFDDDGKPIKAIGKDGKEITIYEVKDGKITIKGKQYPIKLKDGFYIIRKLTVSECKRLQTVPEWYEFPVSNSQAYKMLGNGWTCEVIAHLIRSCYGRTMGRC